jgi:hypothetical protein
MVSMLLEEMIKVETKGSTGIVNLRRAALFCTLSCPPTKVRASRLTLVIMVFEISVRKLPTLFNKGRSKSVGVRDWKKT